MPAKKSRRLVKREDNRVRTVARVERISENINSPLDFRATHRAFGPRGGFLGFLNARQIDADDLPEGVAYAVNGGGTLILSAALTKRARGDVGLECICDSLGKDELCPICDVVGV